MLTLVIAAVALIALVVIVRARTMAYKVAGAAVVIAAFTVNQIAPGSPARAERAQIAAFCEGFAEELEEWEVEMRRSKRYDGAPPLDLFSGLEVMRRTVRVAGHLCLPNHEACSLMALNTSLTWSPERSAATSESIRDLARAFRTRTECKGPTP